MGGDRADDISGSNWRLASMPVVSGVEGRGDGIFQIFEISRIMNGG
jgi:hypothetical protein